MLSTALGLPTQGHGTAGASPEVTMLVRGLEHPPGKKRLKKLGLLAWRKKVKWRPQRNFPVSEGTKGKLERDSLSGTVVTRQGVTGPNWKMANLA